MIGFGLIWDALIRQSLSVFYQFEVMLIMEIFSHYAPMLIPFLVAAAFLVYHRIRSAMGNSVHDVELPFDPPPEPERQLLPRKHYKG